MPVRGIDSNSLSLHSLRQFSSHARVHLDCCTVLCFLQDSNGKVACAGTNFEDLVRGFEVCLRISKVTRVAFNRMGQSIISTLSTILSATASK
jgi:hypothetical protein